VAGKRGFSSSEKAINSKPTAATEPEVSKKCQTMFSHANTIKRPKKCQTMMYMPNTIFSCQTTLKKANFLKFSLKNANLATLASDAIPA